LEYDFTEDWGAIYGKVYFTPPNYLRWSTSPSTIKLDFLPLELSKTDQITPQAVLNGGFDFFFFIYFG
jgi:hypothetical protein